MDAGSPPERRLVDRSSEAQRGRRGQSAGIARPSDIEEIAGWSAHACDFEVPAKTAERPVEGAHKPGHPTLLPRHRSAAPFIRPVEEPDARKAECSRNGPDLGHVGRSRARQPMARDGIHRREQYLQR